MVKLHPRTMPVRRAEVELEGWLIDWQERHDLTLLEVARALLSSAELITKYMLRAERHPGDPERKADEE